MSRLQLKNGATLHGVELAEYYPDGTLKECTLGAENRVATPYGELIPQYREDSVRRKFTRSLSFYPSGALRSISLETVTDVPTPIGPLPAELLTFYESGRIRRLFPLNGKLSGFWSEENEYALAPRLEFRLPALQASVKPLAVHFYESGAVRSLTLWPLEKLRPAIAGRAFEARIGVSFYETGEVQSLEPLRPTPAETPIGGLTAFDMEAAGLCGDRNSLCFDREGRVVSLKTSQNTVTVLCGGRARTFGPTLRMSHYADGLWRVEPMTVCCEGETVFFNGEPGGSLKGCQFLIRPSDAGGRKTGNGCPGCAAYRLGE